ncbi:kinase [Nocardiopsis sp. LDBS1602]|uniref:kinase n=1 Tax=Nocardiopsis sp. LDBS1602 TaxID=3109597 RepID=UPI002DB94AB9|nr:kinase [Nocardiopsis sp. LDBS1602]MEC3892957.1 kinase [Nocardiopsis sp. LDBS1602]
MTSPTPTARVDRGHLPPGVVGLGRKDPERVGPYRTLGVIRRDAAGATLLAEAADGALASVRLLPAEVADGPDVRARLAAEAGRLSRARALCLAGYRDADLQAAEPWLATEYVPGRTLGEHVTEHGPLRGETLTALAAGTAEALAAWHALGGLHLALDPSRVVLSPRGPKIVDPGISSATGRPLGDGRWAAPEQGAVDGSADVFAWGLLMRYAATGAEPSGMMTDDPATGAVSDPLASLIGEASRREPGERPTALRLLEELTPGSGGDLGRAVSDLLAGSWTGVSAPEPRRVRRSRTPVVVGAASVVLVGALVGGLLWSGDDSGGPLGALSPTGSGSQDTRGEEDAASDGGSEGTGEAEEGTTLAVESDPTDGAAVVAEALELVRGASDLLYREHFRIDEGGSPSVAVLEYTEEPVRAVRNMNYHPMGASVSLRFGTDLAEEVEGIIDPATGDTGNIDYHRSEGGSATGTELWEEAQWPLEWILEPGAEIEYLGLSPVPHETSFEDTISDGLVFEATEGHHYSGTYVDPTERPEARETVVDFDLWIDDQGHPLRIEASGVIYPENPAHPDTTFDQERDYIFHEPREIHVPEESELGP